MKNWIGLQKFSFWFAGPIVGDVNLLNIYDAAKMEKFHYLVNKILLPLLLPAANIVILLASAVLAKTRLIRLGVRLAA